MRRNPGDAHSPRDEILKIAVSRAANEQPDFHGFKLAKLIAKHERSGKLLAHRTPYKALNRLAESGMLTSDWEDASTALGDGRPRRRLYRITVRGEQAAASAAISDTPHRVPVGRLALEPR